jgi:rhodanese-related sulfurtransferase
MRVLAACVCFWTLLHTTAISAATTQPAPGAEAIEPRSASKAYCGVRCLYAAALAEGVTFAGTDLIRPEYVGSREGSSIAELELAARDHGLRTFAFVNGTAALLRAAAHPVILHVESVPGSGRYDHFVLCLGHRAGRLLILDTITHPGEPAQVMNARDLELSWDGTGIIVSKMPIDKGILAASLCEMLGWGVLLICIAAGWQVLSAFRQRIIPRVSNIGVAAEVVAIAALALVAPSVWAVCTRDGLMANATRVGLVEQTHRAYFLKRVSFPEAARELSSGSATFIDARYAADYGAGHIPGAIDVPVTASAQTVRLLVAHLPRDYPLVVYCQTRSCPFAKSVATVLLQEGFTSVNLLDGGWEEWSAWKQ